MKIKFSSFILVLAIIWSCKTQKEEYVCTPCDLSCDVLAFDKPGICPECTMDLVKKSSIIPEKELVLNDLDIQAGSGKFLIEGGFYKEKTIVVHYYRPSTFSSQSSIIYVLPGAGRNGDEYRDAWIDSAEKHNLLVLSPEYNEENYPGFWSYNLAGMIDNVNIENKSFDINTNPSEWIFNDFERIFNSVKASMSFEQDQFDMFGHSAGGQILHRLAIFQPPTKVNRILASNSGWYTVPTDKAEFPYGLMKSSLSEEALDFSSNLTIFLGENDNAEETRGHLRHTSEADIQGLHRLERGIYFFNTAKEISLKHKKPFHWFFEVIPNIGHDYRAISQAAAEYLYSTN